MVARHINDRPIRHALEQPADPALHARDQIAGDDHHVKGRAVAG
jgi:hypothetical protein